MNDQHQQLIHNYHFTNDYSSKNNKKYFGNCCTFFVIGGYKKVILYKSNSVILMLDTTIFKIYPSNNQKICSTTVILKTVFLRIKFSI